MQRWLPVMACCLATTACDTIFGLERGDTRVTGTYLARTLHNDASGAPLVEDVPLRAAEVSMEVRFEDGSERGVTVDDAGKFTFDPPPGSLYTLTIRTSTDSVYQSRARDLVLVERVPGRLGRVEAPQNTRLALSIQNRSAMANAEHIATTGVWSHTSVQTVGPIDVDWRSVQTAAAESVGLLNDDDAWYLAYGIAQAPFPYQGLLQSARIPNVTMAPATRTMRDGVAVTHTLSQCAHVISKIKSETTRLQALGPTFQWTSGTGWNLSAVPDAGHAIQHGFAVGYEGTPTIVDDLDRTIMYTNPFPGHAMIGFMEINGFRSTGSVSLQSDARVIDRVPDDCATPMVLGATVASLPLAITIAGVRLTGDMQQVEIDRRADSEITWTPTEGAADLWQVTLTELVSTTATPRISVFTTEPRLLLDPDLLLANHTYTLQIRTNFGTPGAADGDFANGTLPRGSTAIYSTTFVVR
ncbi:MAG: hypothetical protein H0T46_16300 [Deltaproteobacteria bacterium]|nr:hypothetical protein [Deltaproteobacteria bacterium]